MIVRRLRWFTTNTIEVTVAQHRLASFEARGPATFRLPLSPVVMTYVTAHVDLQVCVNGRLLSPRIVGFVARPRRDRLPLDHLAQMLDHDWRLDGHGRWSPPGNQRLGARVHLKPSTRRFLEFEVHLRDRLLAPAYGTAEVYIDAVKVSDALVGPGDTGSAAFSFRIAKPIAAEVVRRHVLSCRVGDAWTVMEPTAIRSALGQEWQELPQRNLLSTLKDRTVLNARGQLVDRRADDTAWIHETFEHYRHAADEFQRLWGYDLFPVGGTLLGIAREGGVITFDKDFDSAYASRHDDPESIRQEFKEIITTLLQNGEDIRLLTRVKRYVRCDYFMWFDKTGRRHIDVFPRPSPPRVTAVRPLSTRH